MREILSITKALADETRVRALASLTGGELCLCQIIEVLGLAPSTVSKHMSVLQQAGLVRRRKRGRWHFYRLADGPGASVSRRALDWILPELRGDPTLSRDARKIRDVRTQDLAEVSRCYRP